MSQNAEMQTCPSCGELVPMEYVICVWCGFDLTAERIRRSGISIDNRAALERIRRVVRSPMQAFHEISLLPDLRGGKIILYAIGVMMTFNMITIFSKLQGLGYVDLEPYSIGLRRFDLSLSRNFLLNIIVIIIQPLLFYAVFLVVWKVSVRILALLSKSIGGKGDKEKIRAVIGYSLIPVFFGWTMAWLVRLITPSVSVTNPNSYDAIESALVSVSEQGFGIVGMIFIYIGWLWSTGLAVIGMKHAARLSWIESVMVTAIPYLIFMSVVL